MGDPALARLQWSPGELVRLPKSHLSKLALAARLRPETTLSVKQIAERLHLGKPKGARANLHRFLNGSAVEASPPQLPIGRTLKTARPSLV